jgi:hypothetical protein
MKVWPILVLAASVAPLGGAGCSHAPPLTTAEISAIAEDAFVYGYPLVLMDVTEEQMTSAPAGSFGAPVNHFRHAERLPSPEDRIVVRPNTDTLYSSAWLDLSRGPVILRVPDTHGRYYVMEMMDAWTNVFAAPGTRTTGAEARAFAVVGPGWSGTLPGEVVPLRAPTNTVWILGRTQIQGPDDLPAVQAIQQQYTLTPLEGSGRREANAARHAPQHQASPPAAPPPAVVDEMRGLAFLRTLAALMRDNPAPARDAPILARLDEIGFSPGHPFLPGPEVAGALDQAKRRAEQRIIAAAQHIGTSENGWRVVLHDIGSYGTSYDVRAAVARIGLGANLPEDAVYPTAFVDGMGRPLTGDRKYVIHFAPGQLPPVNAFWSLTLYDSSGYFATNPIGRHAIRDRDALQYNADGSLDLVIQSESPGTARESNWLPAPAGERFNLTLRLYWPRPAVLQGAWQPPPVQAAQ